MIKLQYGFLRLDYFVTSRYRTTIQYTADLAELAYGRFKVSDSLRWDTLYALEFLACFLSEFRGFINFTGRDLAEGQVE